MTINNKLRKSVIALAIATGLAAGPALAYGPLSIFDYAKGTPYRWDVTEPVKVYTDGGKFASGTVWIWVDTPETCNEENGWQCGYSQEKYVEFTNEQGVARVDAALASWSAVPTSSFRAERAGSFIDIGIGGADGDITGAAEEFTQVGDDGWIHQVVGTFNGGGVHVVFDEHGSVMRDVLGVPWGVLGVATPEFADEATGVITEGWVVINGSETYYNDTDLAQMAGVITHELGHSFNLAHAQVNGHAVIYGSYQPAATGPLGCSGHWSVGGDYRLPYPQFPGPGPEHIEVMYPFIDVNPESWNVPTGADMATVDTKEDFAAISSLYPAAGAASASGTIKGAVTYPFGKDGIIGVNIVARNLDNPFADAISVMTGDWNDGVSGAAQGAGAFTMSGLTPGARYVVHAESILAGGFPTPIAGLPGPSEYFNGDRESDDASLDDACDFAEIVVAAGTVRDGVDIRINGIKKAPKLVILPAPSASQVVESGQIIGGTVASGFGDALSWIYYVGRDQYQLLGLADLTLSANGQVMAGSALVDGTYVPARVLPGGKLDVVPTPGNVACDQGSGFYDSYSHYAISPNGEFIGGFLWDCKDTPSSGEYRVHAATWSKANGWSILSDENTGIYSRVNSLADDGTAAGWISSPFGSRLGSIWKNGKRIDLQSADPSRIVEVGEATAITSNGSRVVGIDALNSDWATRGWIYDTVAGKLSILDIFEPCSPFDWFCFGDTPFSPWDVADEGTLVGSIGRFGSAQATLVNDLLGTQKLADFLKAQGVVNATDLGVASSALKVSNNGRHIVGWTAVTGQTVSFQLTLDQLWVCREGRSMQVGYPVGVADQLAAGARLGMCEHDLPLQYKENY